MKKSLNVSLAILALLPCLAFSETAQNKEVLQPSNEGWIYGGDANKGRWSIDQPDFLGVRNRGMENVWAAFISFDLPENLSNLTTAELDLTLVSPRNLQGFWLYGLADASWTPISLRAIDAPGWADENNDVDVEKTSELGYIRANPDTHSIAFSSNKELVTFLKSFAGQSITFIVVANNGSAKLHSTEGSEKMGPALKLSFED